MALQSLEGAALEPLWIEASSFHWEALRWQLPRLDPGAQGVAWVHEGRVQGYLTVALDGRMARFGRLFASRRSPVEAVEAALLGPAIRGAFALPGVHRVCGELLGLSEATRAQLIRSWPDQVRMRCLLELPLEAPSTSMDGGGTAGMAPWDQGLLPAASALLAEAYAGDRALWPGLGDGTPAEACQILESLIGHGEAGRFEPRASFAVRVDSAERLWGLVLACRMGPDTGHIAQLAVAPEARGRGLGRVLLLRALRELRALGCRAAHLVVHLDNARARALYQGLGGRETHQFPALRLERKLSRT
ncbi:MAG TPA: GNAT family N-acetyltransferase [Geothrix sp.]|nr:GNAT family N-acetyltransferase [Geothrix sp.]